MVPRCILVARSKLVSGGRPTFPGCAVVVVCGTVVAWYWCCGGVGVVSVLMVAGMWSVVVVGDQFLLSWLVTDHQLPEHRGCNKSKLSKQHA